MHSNDLFTAPQVAKICSVNLKTIHNWVERGEMKSFRTPGRHLRFRRQDVLEFLTRFGYPVPEGFAPAQRRIVIFADNDTVRPLKRSLSRDYEVAAFADQVEGLLSIGHQKPDLVLVNTDSGQESVHLVERLSSRKESLPVVGFGKALGGMSISDLEFIPSTEAREIRQRITSILGNN